ncbi:hypothetical protein RCH21_001984 [Arthrobacter sp. PL16]|nr:hypothetical protein [Arthrobacter sp. PL16]
MAVAASVTLVRVFSMQARLSPRSKKARTRSRAGSLEAGSNDAWHPLGPATELAGVDPTMARAIRSNGFDSIQGPFNNADLIHSVPICLAGPGDPRDSARSADDEENKQCGHAEGDAGAAVGTTLQSGAVGTIRLCLV